MLRPVRILSPSLSHLELFLFCLRAPSCWRVPAARSRHRRPSKHSRTYPLDVRSKSCAAFHFTLRHLLRQNTRLGSLSIFSLPNFCIVMTFAVESIYASTFATFRTWRVQHNRNRNAITITNSHQFLHLASTFLETSMNNLLTDELPSCCSQWSSASSGACSCRFSTLYALRSNTQSDDSSIPIPPPQMPTISTKFLRRYSPSLRFTMSLNSHSPCLKLALTHRSILPSAQRQHWGISHPRIAIKVGLSSTNRVRACLVMG